MMCSVVSVEHLRTLPLCLFSAALVVLDDIMAFLLSLHLSKLVSALCFLAAVRGITLDPDVEYGSWPVGGVIGVNCIHEYPVRWLFISRKNKYGIYDELAGNANFDGGNLKITDSDYENTGLYTCRSRVHPHKEKSIYVDVGYTRSLIEIGPHWPESQLLQITSELREISLIIDIPRMARELNITWFITKPDRKTTQISSDGRRWLNASWDKYRGFASLTVMNPSSDDAGTYRVMVSLPFFPYEERFVDWKVLAPGEPAIRLKSYPIIMHSSDSYYLKYTFPRFACIVHNIPSPNVTVKFIPCLTSEDCNENQLETLDVFRGLECSNNDYDLPELKYCEIPPDFLHQPGNLSCSAISSTSPRLYAIDHTYVSTEIEDRIIIGNRDELSIISDLNKLELKCGVSKRFYREPTWKFRVNLSTFQLIDEEKGVTIKNINTDHMFGSTLDIQPPFLVNRTGDYDFMCIAFDNKMTKRAAISSIHVKASQDPTIDKNVPQYRHIPPGSVPEILVCTAEGFPAPSIRWYKVRSDKVRIDDGEHADPNLYEFSEGNQILNFTNATEKIEGEYLCEASNIRSTDTLSFNVTLISGAKQPPSQVPLNDLRSLALLVGIFLCLAVTVAAIFFMMKMKRKIKNREGNGPLQVEQPSSHQSPHISIRGNYIPGEWSEALPLNPRWEFPFEKLKLGEVLGQGTFGVVRISEAMGLKANEEITIVAVKQPKHKTHEAVTALVKELKIMDHIGVHVNITNLLGACTKHLSQRELYVILEYCKYGSLYDFLKSHRDGFINEVNQDTGNLESHPSDNSMRFLVGFCRQNSIYIGGSSVGYSIGQNVQSNTTPYTDMRISSDTPVGEDGFLGARSLTPPNAKGDLEQAAQKTMSTTDLLCWGYQIANGMDYLAHRKIVHCDLATRNILLAEGNVVKLCDFGLAKDLGIYLERNPERPPVRKGNERLPIKWMSIEAIEDLTFSFQSDVWAYGVVLWEMFTLGRPPYPSISAHEVLDYLKRGNRMPKPEYATRDVYNLMKECWNKEPMLRPSFKECSERLESSLEEGVKQYYIHLNDDYLDLNKDLDKDREYIEGWLEPTYENLIAKGRAAYVNEEEITPFGPTLDRDEKYRNGAEEDAIELTNLDATRFAVMTSSLKTSETEIPFTIL